jgi:hypothetical protein
VHKHIGSKLHGRKELILRGDLDDNDVPPRVMFCYGTLTVAVLYAIQTGAPTEAYEVLMVIATAITFWRKAPVRSR